MIENAAQVILNQTALSEQSTCTKALGGKSQLIQAATMGLQNAMVIKLASAYLVMNYCLGKPNTPNPDKSAQEIKAYKEALSDFAQFLVDCNKELAESQQKEPRK